MKPTVCFQVLELCANDISHLDDLCVCPPPLIHLGLGHNLLTVIDDYIAGQYWFVCYVAEFYLQSNYLS